MIYIIFIINLLITIIVEGIIIFLLFRKKIYVYYSLLCNMLTNPLLNLLLLFTVKILGQESYFLSLIVLEIAAIITEAIIYELLCDF